MATSSSSQLLNFLKYRDPLLEQPVDASSFREPDQVIEGHVKFPQPVLK